MGIGPHGALVGFRRRYAVACNAGRPSHARHIKLHIPSSSNASVHFIANFKSALLQGKLRMTDFDYNLLQLRGTDLRTKGRQRCCVVTTM